MSSLIATLAPRLPRLSRHGASATLPKAEFGGPKEHSDAPSRVRSISHAFCFASRREHVFQSETTCMLDPSTTLTHTSSISSLSTSAFMQRDRAVEAMRSSSCRALHADNPIYAQGTHPGYAHRRVGKKTRQHIDMPGTSQTEASETSSIRVDIPERPHAIAVLRPQGLHESYEARLANQFR